MDGYVPGDFWRICDVCGFRHRASQTVKRWDGLIVCHADFETRHPQDFVRGRKDRIAVPNPRHEPADVFVGPLDPIETEDGFPLETEDGFYLTVETYS